MIDLTSFIKICNKNLHQDPEAYNYLLNRGITKDQIDKYQFGLYIENQPFPSFDQNFIKWSKGGKNLVNKIIFPLKNSQGKFKAIGTRAYKGNGTYLYYYFNKIEATFFGIENLKKVYDTKVCYLTEGIFDHLVLEQVFENSLCTLTVNISAKQIGFLKRYIKTLILLFDNDDIGNKKSEEIIKYNTDIKIFRIKNFSQIDPKIKDLNELYIKLGPTKFEKFLRDQNILFIF